MKKFFTKCIAIAFLVTAGVLYLTTTEKESIDPETPYKVLFSENFAESKIGEWAEIYVKPKKDIKKALLKKEGSTLPKFVTLTNKEKEDAFIAREILYTKIKDERLREFKPGAWWSPSKKSLNRLISFSEEKETVPRVGVYSMNEFKIKAYIIMTNGIENSYHLVVRKKLDGKWEEFLLKKDKGVILNRSDILYKEDLIDL